METSNKSSVATTFLNVSPVTNQDARKGICDILESHVGSLMGEDNIDIDILVGSDQYEGSMAPLQLRQNLDGFC